RQTFWGGLPGSSKSMGVFTKLFGGIWRSQRDSNPRTSLERAVSWASRRWEHGRCGGLWLPAKGRVLYAALWYGPAAEAVELPNNDHPSEHLAAPPPVLVPRADHPISRANISPNALKV